MGTISITFLPVYVSRKNYTIMKIAIIVLSLIVLAAAKPSKNGDEGKGKGSGPSDEEIKGLATIIEFAQLGGKCEMYEFYKSMVTEERKKRSEDLETFYILDHACPKIGEFVEAWAAADEDTQKMMGEKMVDSFFLLQCSNLIAEAQNLKFVGFNAEGSDLKSIMLETSGPLFDFCKEEFGDAEEEEKALEEAADEAENQSVERRILNLLKQLNKKALA